jgi:hypothetical protein
MVNRTSDHQQLKLRDFAMIMRMVCAVIGHKINRRRVRYDGLDFRTHCRRCNSSMVRHDNGWQVSRETDIPSAT